jgi:hypothetical protein
MCGFLTAQRLNEGIREIDQLRVVNRARLRLGGSGEIFSELGLQLVNLADVLSELGVGGALADAG